MRRWSNVAVAALTGAALMLSACSDGAPVPSRPPSPNPEPAGAPAASVQEDLAERVREADFPMCTWGQQVIAETEQKGDRELVFSLPGSDHHTMHGPASWAACEGRLVEEDGRVTPVKIGLYVSDEGLRVGGDMLEEYRGYQIWSTEGYTEVRFSDSITVAATDIGDYSRAPGDAFPVLQRFVDSWLDGGLTTLLESTPRSTSEPDWNRPATMCDVIDEATIRSLHLDEMPGDLYRFALPALKNDEVPGEIDFLSCHYEFDGGPEIGLKIKDRGSPEKAAEDMVSWRDDPCHAVGDVMFSRCHKGQLTSQSRIGSFVLHLAAYGDDDALEAAERTNDIAAAIHERMIEALIDAGKVSTEDER